MPHQTRGPIEVIPSAPPPKTVALTKSTGPAFVYSGHALQFSPACSGACRCRAAPLPRTQGLFNCAPASATRRHEGRTIAGPDIRHAATKLARVWSQKRMMTNHAWTHRQIILDGVKRRLAAAAAACRPTPLQSRPTDREGLFC
eukprot:5854479-Alexandrium_andersonii.AAC.1